VQSIPNRLRGLFERRLGDLHIRRYDLQKAGLACVDAQADKK